MSRQRVVTRNREVRSLLPRRSAGGCVELVLTHRHNPILVANRGAKLRANFLHTNHVVLHPHAKSTGHKGNLSGDLMSIEYAADRPQWFAICTHPKQEDRAYYNLLVAEVECFNPRIQECRRNEFTGAITLISRPLFPRYIFARFNVQNSLRTVRYTRGVLSVVSFNLEPAPIDDEAIELLKSRVGKDGFLNIGEALNSGDKVRIKDGPWGAVVGIVERDTQPNERGQILLTAINYQARLMIERQLV